MRTIGLLIIVAFLLSGCAGVDVYTFKKERIDQKAKGNKGYLEGEAPASSEKVKKSERTLIGVDMDVTGLIPVFGRKTENVEAKQYEEAANVIAAEGAVTVVKSEGGKSPAVQAEESTVRLKDGTFAAEEAEEEWIK